MLPFLHVFSTQTSFQILPFDSTIKCSSIFYSNSNNIYCTRKLFQEIQYKKKKENNSWQHGIVM